MSQKILHITEQLGVGGTEVLLKNTLPFLPEYQHIVVYLGGDDTLKESFSGYPVYCLQHTGKSTFLRSVKRLRKICKEQQVTIIHAHLLWSSFIARLAKPSGVRLITTIHSVLSKDAFEKNKLSLWMERLTTHRQNDIIGVSQYVIDDYLKYVPFKGNTHLLYNFVPDYFFDAKEKEAFNVQHNKKMACIAIGNLKAVKNYEFIVDAFACLPNQNLELDIIGEGESRTKLQAMIDDKKLPIHLLGSRDKLHTLLPAYDLFIQASKYEGFGLAVVEAVAAGLVPVLSDIPVHREITNGKAWYFDLHNPESLISILQSFEKNPPEKERLLQLQQQVRKIAAAECYFEKLRAVYNS